MTLILAPVAIVVALLMMFAPSVASLLFRVVFLLSVMALVYVMDGQGDHPWFHHNSPTSAVVK